jgi:hypothetical protein
MGIEYSLGQRKDSAYQELICDESAGAIIREICMLGFGDCIRFQRENPDGSRFGSAWGLHNLRCFRELGSYTRLIDMPDAAVTKLAKRMYELLFMRRRADKEYYPKPPRIDKTKPEFRQILEELLTLQKTQRRFVNSGQIVFPGISEAEIKWVGLW